MATRVAAVGEVTSVEEMEKRLDWLVEQVEREKEKTRDTFQQLHNLLTVREEGVLRELDGVVVEARQELKEKREVLQELQATKESTEHNLGINKLIEVQKKNLQNIEDEIREELSKSLNVTWVEVEWQREQLEQSIVELCRVVKMKKGPFRTEHYSLKLRPVWYHEGTGSSVIEGPRQLAIHTKSGNIFVTDRSANKILVFDESGHFLYHIPSPEPRGVCLSDEFIFVTTHVKKLLKIQISKKKVIKTVITGNSVYGMDISDNIFVCECNHNSVSVFDTNLNFLKRIPLKTPHIIIMKQDNIPHRTSPSCIKLYENNMYIMFGWCHYTVQIFSQDGQLIKVTSIEDIFLSSFFSLDQFGNIIVADCSRDEIRIFSNSGQLIHTISNDNLTEDQKLVRPVGISVDKQNNIVIAHKNKKCSLIAF